MNIIGIVISVDHNVTIAKHGGGSYVGTRLTYRDDGGSLREQNFTQQTLKFNKGIGAALTNLKAGEKFTMVKEKEGEFWNVKQMIVGGGVPDAPPATQGAKPAMSPKSTYETPEERAARQVMIVRQSSISSAINMLGISKKSISTDEVIAVAKEFEAYVMGKEEVGHPSFDDMEDDMPA